MSKTLSLIACAAAIALTAASPAYAATAANSQNGTTSSGAANEGAPGTTKMAPDAAPSLLPDPTSALASPVGQLSCNVSGGAGFVITSSHALDCEYTPTNGARSQHYVGTINSYGLTLGDQGPGKLTWAVASVGGPVGPGSLAGTFRGGSASASVGAGIGTNALFGGLDRGLTLQPLSVQSETGVNVAAGVTEMTLEYTP